MSYSNDGKKGHIVGRIRRQKQRMALSEENKIQFTIAMRPQNEAQTLSRTDEVCIYKEYLHRYLESMGVTPTPATLHQVQRKIPLVYSSQPSVTAAQVAKAKERSEQQQQQQQQQRRGLSRRGDSMAKKSSMLRKASRLHNLTNEARKQRRRTQGSSNRGGMNALSSSPIFESSSSGVQEDPTPRNFGQAPVINTAHSKHEDTSGDTKYKIRLIPNWKAQGWSNDCVQVAPAVRRKSFDWVKKIVVPDDVLSQTLRKEESAFAHLRLLRRETKVKPVDVDRIDDTVNHMTSNSSHFQQQQQQEAQTDLVSLDELMADEEAPFRKLPRVFLFHNFNFAQAYLPFQKLRVDFSKYNGTDYLDPFLDIEADTQEAIKECPDPVSVQQELQRPARCRIDDILTFQQDLVDAFPMAKFKHVYSPKDLAAASEVIVSHMTAELVALLSHHVYWTLFGHWSAGQLSKAMREEIIIGIQQLSLPLDRKLRVKKSYTLFQLPLFLDSLCSTVTNVLQKLYPRWFRQESLKQRTYDSIITIIAEVISSVQYLKMDIHVAANTRLVQDEEELAELAARKQQMKKLSPVALRKQRLLQRMKQGKEEEEDGQKRTERIQHKLLDKFVGGDAYSQDDLRVNESKVALSRKSAAAERKRTEQAKEQAQHETNTLSGVLGGKIQSNVSVFHSTSKFVQSIFPDGEDFRAARHRRGRLLPEATLTRKVPGPLGQDSSSSATKRTPKKPSSRGANNEDKKMSRENRLVLYQIAVNRVKRRHKKLGLDPRILRMKTRLD